MIYTHNNEYYVLVSSNKLVKVNAIPSNGGVALKPTCVEIHLENDGDIIKYKPITTEEIKKTLTAPKKEEVKEEIKSVKIGKIIKQRD